eukprot:318528-Hanusia_phi.AAC.2
MGEPRRETVENWTSQHVSQWIFERDPELQHIADAFIYHNITGEILLELKESDFMKIIHDRHVTMKQEVEFLEHLSKLQRYFKKSKTRQRARAGVSGRKLVEVSLIAWRRCPPFPCSSSTPSASDLLTRVRAR